MIVLKYILVITRDNFFKEEKLIKKLSNELNNLRKSKKIFHKIHHQIMNLPRNEEEILIKDYYEVNDLYEIFTNPKNEKNEKFELLKESFEKKFGALSQKSILIAKKNAFNKLKGVENKLGEVKNKLNDSEKDINYTYSLLKMIQSEKKKMLEDVNRFYNLTFGTEPYLHPVAQKMPNTLGLHDMIGNIWEICESFDEEPVIENRMAPKELGNPYDVGYTEYIKLGKPCMGGAWNCDLTSLMESLSLSDFSTILTREFKTNRDSFDNHFKRDPFCSIHLDSCLGFRIIKEVE